MAQPVLALGRDGQHRVPVLRVWRHRPCCRRMRRGHRWLSCLGLPSPGRVCRRDLPFRLCRVPALPCLGGSPEYLSRRGAEHGDDAVRRRVLRRVPAANALASAACHHGPVGQPAWRLPDRLPHHRRIRRRGLAEAGLGGCENLRAGGAWLPCRDVHQSARLARLRGLGGHHRPFRAGLYRRVAVLVPEHVHAGEHSRHHLRCDLRGAGAALPQEPLPGRGAVAVLAVPVPGYLPVQVHVVFLPVLHGAAGASSRPAVARSAEPVR
ncbi:hypothetical protein KXW36_009207, partial [Aspergillus fumigatus]